MELSILFKTHPPQTPSMEKIKNNTVLKSFLRKNKHSSKKLLGGGGIRGVKSANLENFYSNYEL